MTQAGAAVALGESENRFVELAVSIADPGALV